MAGTRQGIVEWDVGTVNGGSSYDGAYEMIWSCLAAGQHWVVKAADGYYVVDGLTGDCGKETRLAGPFGEWGDAEAVAITTARMTPGTRGFWP